MKYLTIDFIQGMVIIIICGIVLLCVREIKIRNTHCPKIVHTIKGDAVLSRDCNDQEYIWTPAPYGVNRVYKKGDEIE